jgi:outer membrane lipoprotein-sorting protein
MMASHRRMRWLIAPALAGGVVVVTLTSLPSSVANASDHPRLPARTAAQLLTAVQESNVENFSGTVKTSTKLGLPSLPDVAGGGGSLSLQTLLAGSHTFRVWVRGAEQQRVAMLRGLAETDVVHNNSDIWTYDSLTMQVTHGTVPAHTDQKATASQTTADTPPQVAAQALKAIDPTTAVSVDRTARVAGRPAYLLVLTPRDHRTLVGRVEIAIDSATALPLRTQIFARGAAHPALSVGFSSISLGTPRASIFHFVPPKGSRIGPLSASTFIGSGLGTPQGAKAHELGPTPTHPAAPPRVIGKGWTAVAVLDTGGLDPGTSHLLADISTPVNGGRLIKTALVSVLVATDGRVYVGSVTGSELAQVALTGRAL